MAIENNEIDQCGTGSDPPPSYQNLLRQDPFANIPYLSSSIHTQNRNLRSCTLCRTCHQEKTDFFKKLTDALKYHTISTESQTATIVSFIIFFALIYIFYLYIISFQTPSYILDKSYHKALVKNNITEDVQEILIDLAKRRIVHSLKECILSNL